METYKNIIGSVEILNIFKTLKRQNEARISTIKTTKPQQQLFYLTHHSKFNQMALEEANMRRKVISLSNISGLIGSSINNVQSLYYAFNTIKPSLIPKDTQAFKDYKDIEKINKTITTKLSLFSLK